MYMHAFQIWNTNDVETNQWPSIRSNEATDIFSTRYEYRYSCLQLFMNHSNLKTGISMPAVLPECYSIDDTHKKARQVILYSIYLR